MLDMCTMSVKDSDLLTQPGHVLTPLYKTVEITLRIDFPFQASNEEKQQRWSRERVWKTEECAEAAELLSGLVAAVIILMLVVKPLWVEGRKKPLWLILCPPRPPNAKLQTGYYTIITTTTAMYPQQLMSLQWA